jgi:hypothetical protein
MGMIPRLEPREEVVPHQAAYDALPPGGALVAIENVIDDARRENAFGLKDVPQHVDRIRRRLRFHWRRFHEVVHRGRLRSTEVIHLAGPASAAVAHK